MNISHAPFPHAGGSDWRDLVPYEVLRGGVVYQLPAELDLWVGRVEDFAGIPAGEVGAVQGRVFTVRRA